jgi:hypothetical protein
MTYGKSSVGTDDDGGVANPIAGGRYHGRWAGNLRVDGEGRMDYQDGSIYIGEWRNCQHHGQGQLISADGTYVYRGKWQNGRKCGEGTAQYKKSGGVDTACTGVWTRTAGLAHGTVILPPAKRHLLRPAIKGGRSTAQLELCAGVPQFRSTFVVANSPGTR